ncbi:LysE family translocator [Amycolatopsis sp. NPDC098790]|uniref:LysE family translocator n=1 Tax=Amycolatopsis sp. NPDC098790 TaxID=3363939 RepID=UPI003808845B
MPTQQTVIAFAVVAIGLVLVPGPSNFFLLAQGIGHGRRAALTAAAGIEAAALVRILLAATGLAAVPASSAVAFETIRWAGAGYLVVLGVRAWRAGPPAPAPGSARRGFVVGLANPKMIAFHLAFFPQFVYPDRGSAAGQILVLGAVFWAIGAVWDVAFACASGSIGSWLRRRPGIAAAQPRVEGLAYWGLAGWAAVTR